MCHRDRLKAWKPDDQLTRELASLNEGRRSASIDEPSWPTKSRVSLRSTFLWRSKYSIMISPPLWRPICSCKADFSRAPESLSRQAAQVFYGHHSRQEKKILERLALIRSPSP